MVLLQPKRSNAAQNQRDILQRFLSIYNGDLGGTSKKSMQYVYGELKQHYQDI